MDQFCEEAETDLSHNPYRPNKHNAMCNRQSTWSVILQSDDFKTAKPMEDETPPDTIFKILRPQDERFVFVLDVSGSMVKATKRIDRLKQSTQRWIQHEVGNGSLVGVTSFRWTQLIHLCFSNIIHKLKLKLVEFKICGLQKIMYVWM